MSGIMPGLGIVHFILLHAFLSSHAFLEGVIPSISSQPLPDLISRHFGTYFSLNSHLSRRDNIFSTISTDGVKKSFREVEYIF